MKKNKDIVYRGDRWLYVSTVHMVMRKLDCYVNSKSQINVDNRYEYNILIIDRYRLLPRLFKNICKYDYFIHLYCISTPKKLSEADTLETAKIWFDNMEVTGKSSNCTIEKLMDMDRKVDGQK